MNEITSSNQESVRKMPYKRVIACAPNTSKKAGKKKGAKGKRLGAK